MFRVVYEKHVSGNYHVTLMSISQTISLRPGYLKKIINIKDDVLLGCMDINAFELEKLGFVIGSFWTRKNA